MVQDLLLMQALSEALLKLAEAVERIDGGTTTESRTTTTTTNQTVPTTTTAGGIKTLDKDFLNKKPFSKEELTNFCNIMKPFFEKCEIRGI